MSFKSITATVMLAGSILAAPLTAVARDGTFAERVYQSFQTGQVEQWDTLFHEDVITNSSAAFGVVGREALKKWANAFLTGFAPRIDLVDQINAIDESGNGRAVATINLNWTHVKPFFGLQPTGRSGTSIENLIMTVRDGKVVRMEVADTTLDLVIYMHERGWIFPQNIRPVPIIRGISRDVSKPVINFAQ